MMKQKMSGEKYKQWVILLIALLVIVSVFNIWAIWKITQLRTQGQRLSIPKSFVMNYPYCANKLLELMNISNVHIEPMSNVSGKN